MSTEQRLDELEIRFSHQDDFLQQLNSVVITQQKTIDRLEKEILDLKRPTNSNADTIKNEKPPHY